VICQSSSNAFAFHDFMLSMQAKSVIGQSLDHFAISPVAAMIAIEHGLQLFFQIAKRVDAFAHFDQIFGHDLIHVLAGFVWMIRQFQ